MYARGDPPRRTLLDRSGRMLFAGVWRLMDWNLHRSKKGVDILRSISSNHPRRFSVYARISKRSPLGMIEGGDIEFERKRGDHFYFLRELRLFGNISSIRQLSVTFSKC